jgi:hypothetical protein
VVPWWRDGKQFGDRKSVNRAILICRALLSGSVNSWT